MKNNSNDKYVKNKTYAEQMNGLAKGLPQIKNDLKVAPNNGIMTQNTSSKGLELTSPNYNEHFDHNRKNAKLFVVFWIVCI